MKVSSLIKKLERLPQDAEVKHLWDGSAYTTIEFIWISKGGYVVTADYSEVCYHDEDRPIDAPLKSDYRHWSTPVNPNINTED